MELAQNTHKTVPKLFYFYKKCEGQSTNKDGLATDGVGTTGHPQAENKASEVLHLQSEFF